MYQCRFNQRFSGKRTQKRKKNLVISCTEICHLCSSLKGLIKSRSKHKSRCGQMPSFQDVLSCLRRFLATESPLKRMKNAFYFTSKAIFVLKIFKFLSWYFGHVAKRLDKKDKVNFKFYYVTAWLTSNCHTHIVQYLEK